MTDLGALARMIAAMGAALAVAGAAGTAGAATWMLTYTGSGGMPSMATLTLQVSDTLNAVNGYDVQAVSGDVDGDKVTGLIQNPNKPFPSLSADGMFIFDNVVWKDAPWISNPGLFFTGASGDEYNLFSDNPTTFELYRARSGVGYLDHSVGMIAAAPKPASAPRGSSGGVPEPAAWALLILGFGVTGQTLRRRLA